MKCAHCKRKIWLHQKPFDLTGGQKVHNQCLGPYMKSVLKDRRNEKAEILQDLTFIKYDLEENDYVDIHQRKDAEI